MGSQTYLRRNTHPSCRIRAEGFRRWGTGTAATRRAEPAHSPGGQGQSWTAERARQELQGRRRNERSRAAIKKLGATEEGVLRQHIVLDDGYIRDTVVYSILKKEWAQVLPSLNKRMDAFQ